MFCEGCGNTVDENDGFCGNCGKKIGLKATVASNPAAVDGTKRTYCGKRSGVTVAGRKAKVHYGTAGQASQLEASLCTFLTANGFHPTVSRKGEEATIEVSEKNILKTFIGFNRNAEIKIYTDGKDLVTRVRNPLWYIDLIAFFAGIFFFYVIWYFWAVFIVSVVGDMSLKKKINDEIDTILIAKK
jgi:hypothetical protein